jgi:KDO2-lipid IV(A) lauroyltransferase
VTANDRAVSLLARGAMGGLRALSWERARAAGERLGDAVRGLGLRLHVAQENLALAFPQWSAVERERVLREHYRELGRVVAEYAHLDRLAGAPLGEVFVETGGLETLEPLRGRGAILLSGHFSNFELMGAMVARLNPVDFLVKPLSNAGVERFIAGRRAEAGVGCISTNDGTRGVYQSLAAGRWVAILGDQDARQRGLFVPFFGRAASTAVGPARVSLKTGAPIVMGFAVRRPDGRFDLQVEGPLELAEPEAPDAVLRLTAHHVAVLEAWVRARPELWFWLHRRWKTRPRADGPEGGTVDPATGGGTQA